MRSSLAMAKADYGVPYEPPQDVETTSLRAMLECSGRFSAEIAGQTMDMFAPASERGFIDADFHVFCTGRMDLLKRPCVSIVGTRKVSPQGAARARRLARELAGAGVVVVSGLAMGVDTEALTSAIAHGGSTIAVIGTPLDKAYPAQNRRLQEEIYRDHLLISQFAVGTPTFQSNFPRRNKLMAALSDATAIIEASDTSGTLHQAAECQRLGRWLFIARSVVENPAIKWPAKFLSYEKAAILDGTERVLSAVMR